MARSARLVTKLSWSAPRAAGGGSGAASWMGVRSGAAASGPGSTSRPLQRAQHLLAASDLQAAAGVAEVELLTDPAAEVGAGIELGSCEQLEQLVAP